MLLDHGRDARAQATLLPAVVRKPDPVGAAAADAELDDQLRAAVRLPPQISLIAGAQRRHRPPDRAADHVHVEAGGAAPLAQHHPQQRQHAGGDQQRTS